MKNNSAPTKLSVASLKDINALDGFCCGVPLMDKFLHGKFQESIDHNYCKAFVVKDDCDIVAVYALNFDSLSLDIDAKDDLRFNVEYLSDDSRLSIEYGDTFYGKAHYPALEISYLAVSEK